MEEFFSGLGEFLGDADINEIIELFEMILKGTQSITALLNLGITGITLFISIVTAIISFVIWVVKYVVEGIPVYILAKKAGVEWAILAWMPVFTSHFRRYLLVRIPDPKPVEFLDKKIQNRSNVFWLYLLVKYAGPTLISVFIFIVSFFPVAGLLIGSFTSLLYLVPPVAAGFLDYLFLKDVLDMFKEDKKTNNTTSIVVTVLDCIVTFGLARSIYLYSLIKKNPLPQQFQL